MSVTFQKYHLEHHRCQGVDGIDMDIPSHTETYLVTNVVSKSIWVMLQLFFYALQPLFLKPKPPGYRSSLIFLSDNPSCCHDLFLGLEIFCLFDPFHIRRWWYAPNGWSSQNITSSIQTKKHILPNFLTWHVGYHNEHHDFPRIPGNKLHKVREIAPEYHEGLELDLRI
jgi:sphingolipid delta-4 desaturase